jgi:hypothetical protein
VLRGHCGRLVGEGGTFPVAARFCLFVLSLGQHILNITERIMAVVQSVGMQKSLMRCILFRLTGTRRMPLLCVGLVTTDVSEELSASISKVIRLGELRKLALYISS